MENSHYTNQNLIVQRNAELNDFRKIGKFTDITLKINDGEPIKAHRAILATTSSFFKELLNSDDLREDVDLGFNIRRTQLESILDYLYTGRVKVVPENAKVLYEKSQLMGLLDLQNFCGKILKQNINLENCLDYWRFSVRYISEIVKFSCIRFAVRNAESFLDRHLLAMTPEEIKLIITDKEVFISQEKIFLSIAKWVKAQFEDREMHLVEFLRHLDFTKISNRFIETEILSDETLRANKDFLAEIMIIVIRKLDDKLHADEEEPAGGDLLSICSSMSALVQTPAVNKEAETDHGNEKSIYLVTENCILRLDFETKQWVEVFEFKTELIRGFSVVAAGKSIYLTDEGNQTIRFDCRSPSQIQMTSYKQMKINVDHNRLTCLKGKIYNCGDHVEILDVDKSEWSDGPALNEKESLFGLTNDGNSAVYAIGGWNSKTIERYDTKDEKWEVIAPISKNYANKAVFLKDSLYCVHSDSTVKIFDLKMNLWTDTIPNKNYDMNLVAYLAWYSYDVVEFKGNIYAVFRLENKKFKTFQFDLLEKLWVDMEIPVELNKSILINLCVL